MRIVLISKRLIKMSEEINHNCGLCVVNTLHDAYSFIKSLQHRGREAVGIAAVSEDRIDVIKWKGVADDFDLTDLHKIFANHDFRLFMAHVRYATRGRKDKILEDAHPHVIGGKAEDRGSHIIITDCEMAAVHNGQVNEEYFSDMDKSMLRTGCDSEALIHFFREHGENNFLRRIPGSYTIAIADKRRKGIVVMRDGSGIKPGVLGWKDGRFGIASEDIAFRKNGGEVTEDLEPGTVYYLGLDGRYTKLKIVAPQIKHCFFEWNYLADVDSVLNGASVRSIRRNLGEILAEEFIPEDADLVTFLPRCPEVAATSYAATTKIPFEYVFYKMKAERAFQGSTNSERRTSIDRNLYILPEIRDSLRGKTIVLIDDSTVRGNNIKKAGQLLHEAGVSKIYHLNYTPPLCIIGKDGIARGCFYGVDMPPNASEDDRYAARSEDGTRNRTIDEISEEIGAQVHYISREGMFGAYERLGIPRENLCTFCIGGQKPF